MKAEIFLVFATIVLTFETTHEYDQKRSQQATASLAQELVIERAQVQTLSDTVAVRERELKEERTKGESLATDLAAARQYLQGAAAKIADLQKEQREEIDRIKLEEAQMIDTAAKRADEKVAALTPPPPTPAESKRDADEKKFGAHIAEVEALEKEDATLLSQIQFASTTEAKRLKNRRVEIQSRLWELGAVDEPPPLLSR